MMSLCEKHWNRKGAPEFPDGMKKDLDLAKYQADVSTKQPTAYSFKEPTFAKKLYTSSSMSSLAWSLTSL